MDNSLGGIDCWETLHAIHCGESVGVVIYNVPPT